MPIDLENLKLSWSTFLSKVCFFFLQILIYSPNLGVAQIIRWEQALEKGENIEAEVSQAGLPKTVTIEVICESVGSFYCFSGPIYVHPWHGTLS